MKTLYWLRQPLKKLQRSKQLGVWLSAKVLNASGSAKALADQSSLNGDGRQRSLGLGVSPKRRNVHKHPPVIWVLAVVSLTSVMGNRFYSQPKLDVGKAAPQTMRAPFDVSVEDTKTTDEKRRAARTGSVLVLMVDASLTQDIDQKLEQSLDEIEDLRQLSGAIPFIDTAVLTDLTQQYLRQSKDSEWQAVLERVNNEPLQPTESGRPPSEPPRNLAFAQAVRELQDYRQRSSRQAFLNLIDAIALARQSYAQALTQLGELRYAEADQPYDASLLALSDPVWQETRLAVTQVSKRILTQGIPPGLPPDIITKAVKMQMSPLIPPDAKAIAIQILMGVLQPNLTEDKAETKRRAEQAAQAVEPEIVSVRQGEVIVQAGEAITQSDFVLLDYFGLSRREINWLGLVGFGSLVTGGVVIFGLVEGRGQPRLRSRDHLLLVLLSLSTPLLEILGFHYTNLPAIGLLVGSFYRPVLGITVVSLLSGLVTFSMSVSWEYLVAGSAGGILAALLARMRSREELALLGGAVGLTQGTVYLLVNLIVSASAGTIWYAVLPEAALYGLSGLAWSVVALGVSPYLERLFDLVTPIRLAELANPNRPLLKRLATEAPGTFQHTLFVASLAEAAARELHCNVELVRAGTLYHDIGKLHDPLAFIENQMGGPNKHDAINDPWKSAAIIKKHVAEGLVMARKHQLPKAIQDFIPEHQGTLLISYFYVQAQQRSPQEAGPPVRESDFRYDGPIPQSRETGVVMVADACEAALRSLKNVTPETALAMINKILKARWQENQLVDSGLTREDLSLIAEVFVRVWQQCNHQRIAYPKAALNDQPSQS